ncbi:MAG: hypothetical protein JWR59_1305 [Brevundimonas sp.]|nr:hypothetical protein [Brevundimonas sp.]
MFTDPGRRASTEASRAPGSLASRFTLGVVRSRQPSRQPIEIAAHIDPDRAAGGLIPSIKPPPLLRCRMLTLGPQTL